MVPQLGQAMKCRQVSFFIHPDDVPAASETVSREVLPMFLKLPNFRGYLALEATHEITREIVLMSFWDDNLDGSEDAERAFIGTIFAATGTNPSRRSFNILGAMTRIQNCFDPSARQ